MEEISRSYVGSFVVRKTHGQGGACLSFVMGGPHAREAHPALTKMVEITVGDETAEMQFMENFKRQSKSQHTVVTEMADLLKRFSSKLAETFIIYDSEFS